MHITTRAVVDIAFEVPQIFVTDDEEAQLLAVLKLFFLDGVCKGKILERDGYEYSGPIAHCGGGPSGEQRAAAASQANLNNQLAGTAQQQQQFFEKQQNAVNPFYQSRMQNGLPYMNQLTDASSGLTARAFAPARQQLMQSLGTQQGLPSGYRDSAIANFNEQQGQAFDQQLLGALGANEQAKQQGAAGLLGQAQMANPLGYYGSAQGGNQSIMNAPLQRPGIGGLLGGIAGGLASAVPF